MLLGGRGRSGFLGYDSILSTDEGNWYSLVELVCDKMQYFWLFEFQTMNYKIVVVCDMKIETDDS